MRYSRVYITLIVELFSLVDIYLKKVVPIWRCSSVLAINLGMNLLIVPRSESIRNAA